MDKQLDLHEEADRLLKGNQRIRFHQFLDSLGILRTDGDGGKCDAQEEDFY